MIKKAILVFIFIIALGASSVFAKPIKIIHFSDTHIDTKLPDKKIRKFKQSTPMLKKAIQKANKLNPDIVVFSGDMVNRSENNEFDTFFNIAKNLNTNYYPIIGNHDVGVDGGLSKKAIITKINKNCDWLNLNTPYYYVIKDEYIFIFMDGTNDKEITSNGTFSKEALQFLDTILSVNRYKKAIIVQHFPLYPPFKSASHEITNRNEYLDIINRHSNIIMVLSGHYHASKAVQKNNVLYITTPSMIEYPHAFRYLIVDNIKDKIIIQSKLIMDIEQNDLEETNGAIARLKLGLESDNEFTIKLKNNTPTEPLVDFIDKIFKK